MSSTWAVPMDPVGTNGEAEKNQSGIGVFLSADGRKHEVSRVAFVRRYAEAKANRVVPFKKQLQRELEKAYEAAETMNAINAQVADLRRQLDDAREGHETRIRELLRKAEEKRTETLSKLGNREKVLA